MTETDPPSHAVDAHNDIELRLGAAPTHLPIVRSVAGNLATRAEFDLDSIADLKLAVDEACATLITHALPDSILVCRFAITVDELRLTATVMSGEPGTPSTGSFGWRVLETLADSASSWSEAGVDGAGHQLHIELAKRKQAVAG